MPDQSITFPVRTEAQSEAAIDRAVWRRLETDCAYNNAENAEAQAEREQEIADEETARHPATCGHGVPLYGPPPTFGAMDCDECDEGNAISDGWR